MSEFPFNYPVEVVFRDVDMMGHVNHAVFFSYMEAARIKYFKNFFTHDRQPWPVILVRATCDYKLPGFLGDLLMVETGISRFGNTSMTLHYHITRGDDLLAIGETVIVMYDYATEKPFAIPKAFRERIEDFQAGWLYSPNL